MRIHRINCISSRPFGGHLVDGSTHGLLTRGRCVNHCLVVETGEGLLLVDTGLGTRDVLDPDERLAPGTLKWLAPELRMEMTALRQIEGMGFRPDDVRDIVLTHMDCDQVGGLDDFPRARVHVLAGEERAAKAGTQRRYRAQQWSTRPHWVTYDALSDAPWKGFDCVRDLIGLPADLVLLVPLPGHTPGHAGVAICAENGWHLHCGDAYADARQLDNTPQCRFGMQAYERLTATDRVAHAATQERLRVLHYKHPDVILNCARDPREFERLAGRAAHLPADAVTALARDPYMENRIRKPRRGLAAPDTSGIEVVDHDLDTFDLERLLRAPGAAPQQPSP